MTQLEDNVMGRLVVDFDIANYQDVLLAKLGSFPSEKIRRARLRGVVDTGATRLVLSQSVVTELGLPAAGETKVRYADQRSLSRQMVTDVWLELQGRHSTFSAIVAPGRSDALIGAIVLEELDFMVDCPTRSLHPRDPDHIVSEIE